MPEETSESRAEKLAKARRKLKEYQQRGGATTTGPAVAANVEGGVGVYAAGTASTTPIDGSISSNISERSDSEVNLNGHEAAATLGRDSVAELRELPTAANYFNGAQQAFIVDTQLPTDGADITQQQPMLPQTAAVFPPPQQPYAAPLASESTSVSLGEQNLNAIQVLINEKAQLTGELNKYRNQCRERDLELEELRTQYTSTTQRLDELHQRYVQQQQSGEQLRHNNAELQHQMAQANARNEEQTSHLEELKKELQVLGEKCRSTGDELKAKSNELEMAQLRIRQISDESNISKDTRVETLTQNQFMYEQQIRDLQAMVQQLQQDKEQASLQYQNYTQHLNAETSTLQERNAELLDECAKLQERERQLVDHISGLERDIQKNISRQDQLKAEVGQEQKAAPSDEATSAALKLELEKLNDRLSDFELERHEFQLKIKSQEDHLDTLRREARAKDEELLQLRNTVEQLSSQQPDTTKLLATMESDKVAASRAVQQNVELKRQLDELERRFVELTNDKADLMNQLDSEVFANREMRTTFEEMQERVRTIDERFKFKDEEMIRLSHENMDLTRQNQMLQQQVRHYEVRGYSPQYETDNPEQDEHGHGDSHDHAHEHKHDHEHAHDHEHGHDHAHEHEHPHNHNHAHEHGHDHEHCSSHKDEEPHEHGQDHSHKDSEPDHSHEEVQSHEHKTPLLAKKHSISESSSCHEATESHGDHVHAGAAPKSTVKPHTQQLRRTYNSPVSLPTAEAVEKLERRFTKLISQVADLTDEKQRLEHLVLQLQGETETIGEYITLYQTQRRILKQREYEKAAQTRLLQEEREQLREKITLLNNLVTSLGVELPAGQRHLLNSSAYAGEQLPGTIEPTNGDEHAATGEELKATREPNDNEVLDKLNTVESQQILSKIQHIITEITEDTKKDMPAPPTVDNLNCCLGKFEVV